MINSITIIKESIDPVFLLESIAEPSLYKVSGYQEGISRYLFLQQLFKDWRI